MNCAFFFVVHLVADNLGWFGNAPVNIETIMAQKGEDIVRKLTGALRRCRRHIELRLASFTERDLIYVEEETGTSKPATA